MKKIPFVLLLVAIHSNLFCQDDFSNSEVEKTVPFSNKSVTLNSSWVKHREDLNTEYIKSLDPDRLQHNFRINAELQSDAQPRQAAVLNQFWEIPV